MNTNRITAVNGYLIILKSKSGEKQDEKKISSLYDVFRFSSFYFFYFVFFPPSLGPAEQFFYKVNFNFESSTFGLIIRHLLFYIHTLLPSPSLNFIQIYHGILYLLIYHFKSGKVFGRVDLISVAAIFMGKLNKNCKNVWEFL